MLSLQGVSDYSNSTEYRRASFAYYDGVAEHAIYNIELFEEGLSLF
jgi:hypothetical protein